jgi:hypothetical protein
MSLREVWSSCRVDAWCRFMSRLLEARPSRGSTSGQLVAAFPGGGGATLVCRERFVIGPCLGCFLLLRTRRLRVDCQPPGPWRLRPKRWRAVQSDSVVTAGLALVASQLLVASTSCSLGCIAPALLGVLLQTGSLLRWVCSHYLRRPALHGGWQCSCDCNWPPLKSFRWRVAVLHFPCTILGHLTSG